MRGFCVDWEFAMETIEVLQNGVQTVVPRIVEIFTGLGGI